jgi:iron complex outermembrane receptor protein
MNDGCGRRAGRRASRKLMMVGASGLALAVVAEPIAMAQGVLTETITVTAQRREQNQQDVGIAITALSGNQLQDLGYSSAQDVAAFAPGVVAVQPNGEGSYSFAIRGVANNDLSTNIESPVAVYVDEMYISQMAATGFLLFDIDSVEILRGPQGTLFGRNATGGLVHYLTTKPGEDFEGYGQVEIAEYGVTKMQGAVNLPLTDNLYARVSAANNQGTGYVTNRMHPELKLNNTNDYAGRLQLLWDATDDLSVLLNVRQGGQEIRTGFFEYISAVNGGGEFTPGAPNPLFGGYIDEDGDPYAGDYDFQGHNISELFGASATVKWNFGDWQFTSLTDFQSTFRDYIEDTDASPTNYYNYFQTNDAEQFTQEFRLTGDLGPVRTVVGAYYLTLESQDSTGGIAWGSYGYTGGDPTAANGDRTPSASEVNSISLYGQGEYAITDSLTLIGGLRVMQDKKDFVAAREDVHFDDLATSGLDYRTTVISTLSTFDPEEKEDNLWSARLQLNWEPTDDLLTYVSFNRGIKSSGFSQPPFDPNSDLLVDPEYLSYDPETLYAYEVGAKWTLLDGLARINSAIYYYDYKDYQAYTNFPGGLGSATVNAQGKNMGFETEIMASPLDGLDLVLGVGYGDIEVTEVIGFEGMTLTSVSSPEWKANALARYEFPIGEASIALQADASYQSEHYFSLDVTPATTEDGYTLANFSATYYPPEGNWEVTAFVDNAFDETYKTMTFDLSDWIGMVEDYYGDPRWAGVRLNYNF